MKPDITKYAEDYARQFDGKYQVAMLKAFLDGFAYARKILVEEAWNYFKHDVRINYIHTFGTEPREGVMKKCKENWIKSMED